VKVATGKTAQQAQEYVMAATGGEPPAGPASGELAVSVFDIPPGRHGTVVLDLAPGHYAAFCSGHDNEDPDPLRACGLTEFDVA
jgi:hypothetical protein